MPSLDIRLSTMTDEYNLLTSVPASLSCYVLREWLDLKSLGKLDCAFCNLGKRSHLLGLLRSDECICNYVLVVTGSRLIDWALSRQVKCTDVFCSRGYDQDLLRTYLEEHAIHVRTLVLSPTFAEACSCRNLTHVSCPLTEESCTLIGNNLNLQELCITSGPDMDSTLNDAFCPQLDSIHLPHLTRLSVNLGGLDTAFGARRCLFSLIKMSPSLCKFSTQGSSHSIDSATWIATATLCPALRELYVANSNIDGEAMVEFARLCPQITTLNMTIAVYLFDSHFRGLVRNLKDLRSLTLKACNNLSDESLICLGEEGSNLKELVLLYNNNLTRRAAKALLEQRSDMSVSFNDQGKYMSCP